MLAGAAPHQHRPRGRACTCTRSPRSPDQRTARRVRVTLRHKARYVSESLRGLRRVRAGVPGGGQRLRLRREPAHGDLASVRQRRARHLRHRQEGLEPVQERLRGAHLGPGLRGAGRRRPLRGRLPRGQRPQPLQQRLRPHLHPPLRDRLRPRPGGRADRHRRHQALRGRHRRPDRRPRRPAGPRRARGHRRRRPGRHHRRP